MSQTDTQRNILVDNGGIGDSGAPEFDPQTQVAIPWCTTHNERARIEKLPGCWWVLRFDEDDDFPSEVVACEISTGGPNHKWWRDASE